MCIILRIFTTASTMPASQPASRLSALHTVNIHSKLRHAIRCDRIHYEPLHMLLSLLLLLHT